MATVRKADKAALVAENRELRAQLAAVTQSDIVAHSQVLRSTLEMARQAANSTATVLLLGESGTGKELLARYIHRNSPRATRAFVPVNCAALPETILESELFGHEKGAFTGAIRSREGRFVEAEVGTMSEDPDAALRVGHESQLDVGVESRRRRARPRPPVLPQAPPLNDLSMSWQLEHELGAGGGIDSGRGSGSIRAGAPSDG